MNEFISKLTDYIIEVLESEPDISRAKLNRKIDIFIKKELRNINIFEFLDIELDGMSEAEFINKYSDIVILSEKEISRLATSIKNRTLTDIVKYRNQELSDKEIIERIKKREKVSEFQAKTLLNTSSNAISQTINYDKAIEAGIEKFKYVGKSNNLRAFCQERLGKVYTVDEIKNMSNGQGLPVFAFCGGYNCPHRWEPEI